MKPLVHIDVETTGLDPHIHEIIEVTILTETRAGIPPLINAHPKMPRIAPVYAEMMHGVDVFFRRFEPQRIEVAEKAALEVNGYTPERWKGAGSLRDTIAEIRQLLDDKLIVGHHVRSDIGFIFAAIKEFGLERIRGRDVDTMSLAVEHLPDRQRSFSLNAICSTLGIPNDNAHCSLPDALRARACFEKMLRARRRDRLRWWLKLAARG